jgi:hypothetical protein
MGWKSTHAEMPRLGMIYYDSTTVSSQQRQDSYRIIPTVLRFVTTVPLLRTITDDCMKVSARLEIGVPINQ